jgi:hypothetical protein
MTRRLIIPVALAVLAVLAVMTVGGTPAVGNGNGSNIYLARAFLSPYQPYFHGRVGSVRLKCERAYIPELLDDVLGGRINPGRVLDFETNLDHICRRLRGDGRAAGDQVARPRGGAA